MLEEERGSPTGELESHLRECPGCRAQATLLRLLEELPPPAATPAEAARMMERLPLAPWQLRRVATWGPLALGGVLVGAGLVLVGGVPGGSAVSLLPSLSQRVLAFFAAAALDAVTVLEGSAEALRVVVTAGGAGAVAWLLLTAVGGGLAVRSLVRRGARSGR